jgi:hypothetical protein
VQLLRHISDLMNLLPADELRDKVCLSFLPLPLDPNLSSSFVSITCSLWIR